MQKLQSLLSLGQFAENGVLAVEPRTGHEGDEELGPVGVGTGIGHGEQEGDVVLEGEVLVGEVASVDGLAASAVVAGEVAALRHEVGDDAVEVGVLEAEALLVGAQGAEVSRRLGSYGVEEVEHQLAGLARPEVQIEEHVLECTHQNINISPLISTIKINPVTPPPQWPSYFDVLAVRDNYYQNWMISVESHSKQIKLLNDYILALEKQVATAKRETDEVQKAGKMSSEDVRKLTDELSAAKRENEQLKGHATNLEEQLRRLEGLEQEYIAVRGHLEHELGEKQALLTNMQKLSSNNETIYQRMQQMEGELLVKDNAANQAQIRERDLAAEVQRLQKQNLQLKSLLDKKLNEVGLLSTSFNSKAKDYDAHVKRTNEEKSNLLRIIRALQDEKKNLDAANASIREDAHETARAHAAQTKKTQELTLKLDAALADATALRKKENDAVIIQLRKELDASIKSANKAVQEKDQALERESEVLRQKFNSEAFYNNEINHLEEEVQSLKKQIEELNTALKNNAKSNIALQEELRQVKSEYESFRNQSANLSDSHSSEVDLVRAKLREGQRKNAANQQKIEGMAQEIKQLQVRFQGEHSSLQLSRQELNRVHQEYEKELGELNANHEEAMKRKEKAIAIIAQTKEDLNNKLKSAEDSLIAQREESSKNEKQLRETIRQLQALRDSHAERLNSVNVSSLLDSQNRHRKEAELDSLRLQISALESTIKQQVFTLERVTRALADKEHEVQALQDSNAALRKQIITSISNQQASKKELLQAKSKVGSVLSNSRVKSTYLGRGSAVENGKNIRFNTTATNIVRNGDQRSFNKKRTTPPQLRFSMVDESGDLQVEGEELTASADLANLME